MLDVRRLRLLSELARRGTIAGVARAVGYTPSAVSQALLRLERETGTVLLERDGRGVRLTPAAHGLVRRTERILAEIDAAEAELAAESGAVRGHVVVGTFPSAGARLVAPAATALSAEHPDLEFAIREHEPEDGIALLRSGELDLLVSERYEDVPSAAVGGLDEVVLLTDPLGVLVRAESGSRAVPLRSLAEADWIGGLPGTQYALAVERACRSAGFTPRVVHRADDADLIQGLVAAGHGVGLLPRLAFTGSVRFADARPAAPARLIVALLRQGSRRRPALSATLDALAQVASAR